MKQTAMRFFGLAALMLLMGQGCFSLGADQPIPLDGGMYATEDGGTTWAHRVLIPTTTGAPGSVASVSVASLLLDPSDRKAIYAGTKANGMIYSYDQGRTWSQPSKVRSGRVTDIAVDYRYKCNIYVAQNNKILKSDDCSRSFVEKHVDEKSSNRITQIEIDPKNSNILYAGTSTGKLLKSDNAGTTWQIKHDFKSEISRLLIYPDDTNIVYVGLKHSGLHKSADAGGTWINISPDRKEFSHSNQVKNLIWHKKSNMLILAFKSKIFTSKDGGDAWTPLDLISPADATIYGLAANAKNANQMIYTTAAGRSSTMYVTGDGGKTWTSAKPPTTRAISSVLFDPEAPHIMYIGGFALAQ